MNAAGSLANLKGNDLIEALLAPVSFAFQPVVSAISGVTHGAEALIRGTDTLGFKSIRDYFDYAHEQDVLHPLDLALRERAIQGFQAFPLDGAVLFFNLDQRVLQSRDYQAAQTASLLKAVGLPPERLVFELSEKAAIDHPTQLATTLDAYRQQGYRLAIDDFGIGVSGFKLLFEHQPFYLKVDQFFVRGIDRDRRRRLFVSSMANLAHVLGISVVAEGVETEYELRTCREIGCNLVQGYLVARPTHQVEGLEAEYPRVAQIQAGARRRARGTDAGLIRDQMQAVETISIDSSMSAVFDAFRQNKQATFFPVLDSTGTPQGIVREEDLKEYIYSVYGKDLLANPATGRRLRHFLSACPTADVDSPIERVLQTYALDPNPAGIMVLDEGRYAGMLSADSLLRILNDKNIALARDQNPLTKLPGNLTITETIETMGRDGSVPRGFVYFDLDNFKPFNDAYGFRLGDRAIMLMAERLQGEFDGSNGVPGFVGHLGGDDFFAAISNADGPTVEAAVRRVLKRFADDVASFYSPEDRERGYIVGKDRQGRIREFGMLTCSAAVMRVPEGATVPGAEALAGAVVTLKKAAKEALDGVAAKDWEGSPRPGSEEPSSNGNTSANDDALFPTRPVSA